MGVLGVPGIAVGWSDGEEEWNFGLGVTNVDNPLSVDNETLFCIQSNTKPFVALAALRLSERGLLDLDRSVSRIVPGLKLANAELTEQVTTRQLLQHRSGLGDSYPECGRGDDALANFASLMGDVLQVATPGTETSYSNAGYNLAGHVLERATGKPFEQVITDELLAPLGMTNTFFHPEDVIYRRHAACHPHEDGKPTVYKGWQVSRAHNPSGGMVSCVRDLLRWARFHMGDGAAPSGERILSSAAMAKIHKGAWWRPIETASGYYCCHGGGGFGIFTQVAWAPETGVAVVALTNGDNGMIIAEELIAELIGQDPAEAGAAPEPVAIAPEVLAPLAGRYREAISDYVVSVDDDGLAIWSEARDEAWASLSSLPRPPRGQPARLEMLTSRLARLAAGPASTIPSKIPGVFNYEFLDDGRALRTFGRIAVRVGD